MPLENRQRVPSTNFVQTDATVPFSCGFWIVASRFSVNMKVFSQGNPRRRSLQGPRAATTAGLRTQHLVPVFLFIYLFSSGTAVAQWLRRCATNRKVAGSIPADVSGFFIDIKSFRSHYGPGVDSASNRNEYQEYFLGVKAAGA